MNLKLLLDTTKDLVLQPAAATEKMSAMERSNATTLTSITLPYLIAIAVADYMGNVVFGKFAFSESVDCLMQVIVPQLILIVSYTILQTALLGTILRYNKIQSSAKQLFNIVLYTLIPILATATLGGLLPKISGMINLFALYAYYIMWLLLKNSYNDNDQMQKIRLTIIISGALLYMTIRELLKILFQPI